MTERIDNFPPRRSRPQARDTVSLADIQDFVLGYLRGFAKRGERCPTNPEILNHCREHGLTMPANMYPSALANRGLLRSEVYGTNWRVIEIDDYRTAERPGGGEPYKVIDKRKGKADE